MSSGPTPSRRKTRGGRLAAAFVVMLVLVAVLLFLLLQGGVSRLIFPTASSTTTVVTGSNVQINIKMQPRPAGIFERLSYLTTAPVGISFTALSPAKGTSPFTYLWDFDDGTVSSNTIVTHFFAPNCIYDIRLVANDSLGHLSTGTIFFTVFPSKGSGGMLVTCPQRGTAGITKVELAGDFYPANRTLTPVVGGSKLAAVKADSGGSWILNITKNLEPRVNGSFYYISTLPKSVTSRFLTLEGIRASPVSGEPGDYFTLEGRSYPADTTVSISLGGVYVGQANSDSHGTFHANLQVPSALRYAGTYQFATSPPVLGARATFTIPLSTKTPARPAPFPWWLLILALLAAAAVLILLYLRRRRRAAAVGPGKGNTGGDAGSRRRWRQVSLRALSRSTAGTPALHARNFVDRPG